MDKRSGPLIVLCLLIFVIWFILYIFALPLELIKSCVPFNEKPCIAEGNHNATKKAQNKTDKILTSLFKID